MQMVVEQMNSGRFIVVVLGDKAMRSFYNRVCLMVFMGLNSEFRELVDSEDKRKRLWRCFVEFIAACYGEECCWSYGGLRWRFQSGRREKFNYGLEGGEIYEAWVLKMELMEVEEGEWQFVLFGGRVG